MSNNRDRICILVEQEKGQALPLTFELLNAGRKLADKGGEILCACILGQGVADLSDEIAFYADEVYAVDNTLLADFQTDLCATAVGNVCQIIRPVTMLMGHTYDNCELAPKIGFRMRSDVITDCTGLERDSATGSLLCAKPVYGGNAVAVFELNSKPQIVTLRPKIYETLAKGQDRGRVIPLECDLSPSLARARSVEVVPGQSVGLDKAEAIVAGGRGVKTQEGINELRRLAGTLNAFYDKIEVEQAGPSSMPACSRVPIKSAKPEKRLVPNCTSLLLYRVPPNTSPVSRDPRRSSRLIRMRRHPFLILQIMG